MILFRPYSSIKGFLKRFTLVKIGKLHIRLHTILDKDRTCLFHNHPFNYISIILKNGYDEIYLEGGDEIKCKHTFLSFIKRKHNVYHRIDNIHGKTITLFIAYGRYDWEAINNTKLSNYKDGIYKRNINDKEVWSKVENGIWFIGHLSKNDAINETRHSIHQFTN